MRQNSTMSQIGDSGESCGGGLRTEHVTLTLFSPSTHRTVTKKLENILTATIINLILFIVIIFLCQESQQC